MSSGFLFAIAIALFCQCASSARYGVPDNRVHQFAGYLGIPLRTAGAPCGNRPNYASCGGSLVSIPGFPTRRMFITARHCLHTRTNASDKLVVHFGDYDKRIVDPVCSRTVGFVTTGAVVYTATHVWFPPLPPGEGTTYSYGIGIYKEDYGIVLLDTEVSSNQVDKPAVIFDSSKNATLVLPVVGTAGYGLVGWGTLLDGTLGQPLPTQGSRDKMYVQLDITSVQPTNMIGSMNAATLEQALCNGDSGSSAMEPTTVNGVYNLYGAVSFGDVQCRATNTFTRIGTAAYNAWLASIKADVLSKA